MPELFPRIQLSKDDSNPAIRLYGRRFFSDQSVPELLIELLLVCASDKRIGNQDIPKGANFPDLDFLNSWPDQQPLQYSPKARLNLKLFSFLGSSKLATRHSTHRKHLRDLRNRLEDSSKLSINESVDANEVIQTLENLFRGFQSVGGQRTWCAQAFLPVSSSLLASESIWKETEARKKNIDSWDKAITNFEHNKHLFLARGGELLYLQLCNALRQEESAIQDWALGAGLSLSKEEKKPSHLHKALNDSIHAILNACPETVGKLAEFIDSGIESETSQYTDGNKNGDGQRHAKCGWCPIESWPEATLFAVELTRLCAADIDPIEKIELLEIACAMQVLRSLCVQGSRYSERFNGAPGSVPHLGFVWIISDHDGENSVIKEISRRNLQAVQRMIHDAVRHPALREKPEETNKAKLDKLYDDADKGYGNKLFLTVAKRIGLVVPKRGGGARFIFNDRILRFLLLSIIRPGQRVTYDSFKELLLKHYGIAVDGDQIAVSTEWSGTTRLNALPKSTDAWLVEMLEASGFLIRLSDSCSLVTNPFSSSEPSQ